MKKDEIIKTAQEKFNVKLNPKEKLSDLEGKLEALEKKNAEKPKPTKKKGSGKGNPIASKGEYGKVVPWNPLHREEFWTFIYDERALSEEEREKLGL